MTLHRLWPFFAMLGLTLSSSRAQAATQPVSSYDVSLTVPDNVRLLRHADSLALEMNIALWGKRLPASHTLTVTPRLTTPTDSADFSPILVHGRQAYYAQVRSALPAAAGELHFRQSQLSDNIFLYARAIAFRPWMDEATLQLSYSETDGCGRVVRRWSQALLAALPTAVADSAPAATSARHEVVRHEVQTRRYQGTAYVDFPVNRTEILADYRDNRRELDRICQLIDSLRSDTARAVQHIVLKGYASPEGDFQNNARLAQGRVAALEEYLSARCGLDPALVSTHSVAEDWEGLRSHVAASALPQRESILRLIDAPGDPDQKLRQLASAFPETYRHLADSLFPRLRRTDYSVEYVEHQTIARRELQTTATAPSSAISGHTGRPARLVNQLPISDVAALPAPTGDAVRQFHPLLAVKTNLLFDAALAPNVEVEVPLGVRARWSLLGEVWCPWWRLRHNPSGEHNRYLRSDQRPTKLAYELLTAGAEVRWWFAPRCRDARPALTGAFLGLYGAGGKYDLGRNGKGDQGEFTSLGLSIGYSWPVSRHWNLELSAAAGYVGGPKVHYENEFDDTHLIYRHNEDWHYVGPTKLKLSAAWLIGKKGGRR